MFGLGPTELIIILLIVVLIFGAGRIAGIGGALGKSIREFKKEASSPLEDAKEGGEAKASAETSEAADTVKSAEKA